MTRLATRIGSIVLVSLALAGEASPEPEALGQTLVADDECTDETCSINAMQLRGQKVQASEALDTAAEQTEEEARTAAMVAANTTDESQLPSCRGTYQCGGWVRGQNCQCDGGCGGRRDCCWDYWGWCKFGPGRNQKPKQTKTCYRTTNVYHLNWEAAGSTFFDKFTFVSEDFVHGAHQFTTKAEAEKEGTISHDNGRAQLRFGGLRDPSFDGEAYKRYSVNIHTNKAWKPAPGFLTVMKYERLPYGCGIWPSFWAVNSDQVWPKGGELDILEYANHEQNKVTFHIDSDCSLDKEAVERCAPSGHSQQSSDLCQTSYFEGKLGCMPKQRQPTGQYLAEHPGIIAAEWADDHITIFHIPKDEIPQDMLENKPKPASWGRWVIAYLPFQKGCTDTIGPQELVLNMQLCGDWAGATWQKGICQAMSGLWSPTACQAGLSSPTDCCTKWVTGHRAEKTLLSEYMDIEYLKVFTANGELSQDSGTFSRGGVQLS